MPDSPVLELQRKAGATVVEAHGWRLPDVYSSSADEYEAATQGVGLVDRSYVGRLRLDGGDGLDLMDRLSTNKLDDLGQDQGLNTVLTSSKGRIVDLLFVLRSDDHLLVLTSSETRQTVADWIDFYTFTEDVSVEDVTEATAMLAFIGPSASGLLDELSGEEISSVRRYESISATIDGVKVLVIRTDFCALPGYDLVLPASEALQLWRRLLDEGAALGIKPVGMQAKEMVRIERGVPAYGTELGNSRNPLEANLREFISFNKGCYIGQEVVARLDTYKKVQNHLVGLSWESDVLPGTNAALSLEGRKVGAVTSAVFSPKLNKGVGLAYVKKAQAQPGLRLEMESADRELTARVEDLPFRAGES